MVNDKKKIVIVLGGIGAHRELLIRLKQRGYYTLLVDYLDNPPAKSTADIHIKESTLDKEKVLEIAQKWNVSAILSGCVDQANATACYVSERLGIYTPYSYDTAMKINDKDYMKRVMMEQGVLTSAYYCIKSKEEILDADLKYPVMVKPAKGNSANGVKRAENKVEMVSYLEQAFKISKNGKVILEECVAGREFSAYCYIKDGRAKLLMTSERISVIEGEERVIKCYAALAPARIPAQLEIRAEEIATKLAQAFGLNNSFFFFQGIESKEDINIIEFAPRIGGGVCFKTIPLNTGFDVIDAIINSALGEKVDLDCWHCPTNILAVNTVYALDCIFDHVEGREALIDKHVIEDFIMYKTKGMKIDNRSASGGRIGAFIVRGENENDILQSVRKAYDILSVQSSEGEEVLRADLNLYAMRGTY